MFVPTLKRPPSKKIAALAFIFLLTGAGEDATAWAIDVYHFLVEYKNGKVVERVYPEPPEVYESFFHNYVARTKLIEKRHYSVDGFIRNFGEGNYQRLMAGHFGFGPEEEIIFKRQTQGLEYEINALPPPDKISARLRDAWQYLEEKKNALQDKKTISESAPNKIDETKPTASLTPAPTKPPADKESHNTASASSISSSKKEETPLSPQTERPSKKSEPSTRLSNLEEIIVYRFLVQYINDRIVERQSAITPEAYQEKYRGYVKKTALVEKKTYTADAFQKAFGRRAHQLLLQGGFGIGEIEMIMQSRMERGMPPRKNVLPEPGAETRKHQKELKKLLGNRNFTLEGP